MAVPEMLHFVIKDATDVMKARREGMALALRMGFATPDATKIAVVVSELARNILLYAKTGKVTLIAQLEDVKCVKIIAADQGPGIPNVDEVLKGGVSTSNGLGLGLSGSRRIMDEFNVTTQTGKGTTVTAVKWLKR